MSLPPIPYSAPMTDNRGNPTTVWSAFFRQLITAISGSAVIYPISISNGGTGAQSQQAAINALTGTQSVGKYLRSDGSNSTLSTIQAGDIPTLNQNTTGTASNVTGTVAIANGGTGQTSKTAAFDGLSPNTTKGDITAFNGTNNVRVAVGSNGQTIIADSTQATGWKWGAVSTALSVATKTANYTLTSTDNVILADATSAALTITLPAASSFTGSVFTVIKKDTTTNTVTVAPSGTNLISGETSQVIRSGYTSLDVISDGSNWYVK